MEIKKNQGKVTCLLKGKSHLKQEEMRWNACTREFSNKDNITILFLYTTSWLQCDITINFFKVVWKVFCAQRLYKITN